MTEERTTPWYQRTYRWGQTDLTEVDPIRYDVARLLVAGGACQLSVG